MASTSHKQTRGTRNTQPTQPPKLPTYEKFLDPENEERSEKIKG